MTELLEKAIAEIATLPASDQERIGRDMLSYVEKLRRLRTELKKGIDSLARGEGRELNIEELISQARARHEGA